MATFTEYNIDQGQTFQSTLTVTSDLTNADLDLTNYEVMGQIKYSYYTDTVSETFDCSITDAQNGEITVALASANTANLDPGQYVFDIFTISPTAVKAKVLEGLLIVNPSVTNVNNS